MKQLLHKVITLFPVIVVGLVLVSILAYAAGNNQTFSSNAGNSQSTAVTGTYTNSQVDTVTYQRESGVSGLAFSIYNSDSAIVVNIIVRRLLSGTLQPVLVGDTIMGTSNVAWDTTTVATGFTSTVTLAPLADAYVFYVKYGASTMTGTSQTYRYWVNKQYAK